MPIMDVKYLGVVGANTLVNFTAQMHAHFAAESTPSSVSLHRTSPDDTQIIMREQILTVIGVRTFSTNPAENCKRWYIHHHGPWNEATVAFPNGPESKGFGKMKNIMEGYRCMKHGTGYRVEIWTDVARWETQPCVLHFDPDGRPSALNKLSELRRSAAL